MICIVEPLCLGHEHAPVNAGLIKVVQNTFPKADIWFYGSDTHVAAVRAILTDSEPKLGFKTIEVPLRGTGFAKRLRQEVALMSRLRGQPQLDRLILASADTSTVQALNVLHRAWRRPIPPTYVILHSVVAQIWGWWPRNPVRRIAHLAQALKWSHANCRFVVLESYIRDALIEKLPNIAPAIRVLPHPITAEERARTSVKPVLAAPIHFGFLGAATANKGFDYFLDMAETVGRAYPGAVRFSAIGPICDMLDDPRLSWLHNKPTQRGLGRSEFLEAAQTLDYVVMPFRDHYRYAASGTLMDALTLSCPIISSDLPAFRYLESLYGDIGYVRPMRELAEVVRTIAGHPDPERYARQVDGIRAAARARLPDTLATLDTFA